MSAKTKKTADIAGKTLQREQWVPAPMACVSTNLRMAARATSRLYEKALAPLELTVAQYGILSGIARSGEVATMELASQLCLERTTLYRALAVLERRALVAPRPGQGREQILSLTPAGLELREAALPRWRKVQQMLVEEFGENWEEFLNQIRHACKIAEDKLDERDKKPNKIRSE